MTELPAPYDDLRRQFLAVHEEMQNLVDGLSRSQGNWRPNEHSWSIAQCLDHLLAVDGAYGHALEAGLSKARRKGLGPDDKPVRLGFFERMFIAALEPPAKARMKAPKSVVPAADLDIAEVSRELIAKNGYLVHLLEGAASVHPTRAKIRSPLFKLLKLTVAGAFSILATHDRRHLWQARQVRDHPDFPSL